MFANGSYNLLTLLWVPTQLDRCILIDINHFLILINIDFYNHIDFLFNTKHMLDYKSLPRYSTPPGRATGSMDALPLSPLLFFFTVLTSPTCN